MPTAAEPIAGSDALMVAVDGGVLRLAADGTTSDLVPVVGDFPAVRTNDVTSLPDGRLLVGLFTEDRRTTRGGVVAVDAPRGSVSVVTQGYITANGLAVSHDGTDLYAVDTATGTIRRHRLDHAWPSPGRLVVNHHEPGLLDGIVLGPDGDLWVAVWDAGAVYRFTPQGGVRSILAVPVPRPSALAVVPNGGSPMLVVTTARTVLRRGSAPTTPPTPSDEGRLYTTALPD
jgi:sugar lactone lactonase YvrE